MGVKKSDKYFNTTNENKSFVKKRESTCNSQKERVLDIFRELSKQKIKHATASQVHEIYGAIGTPLTSIRRAMSQLANDGILEITNLKRDGLYNYPERFYRLREINNKI
jgi:Fe2+ or Zn2+ uptake regulation protein